MINPTRLKEQMERAGISQSELGRRVGTTQATIYKLLIGESSSSKYLIQIARELDTTAAYLTDETDDPTSDTPDLPTVSSTERQLSELIHTLSSEEQAALLKIVKSMHGGQDRNPGTVHAPKSAFHARDAA